MRPHAKPHFAAAAAAAASTVVLTAWFACYNGGVGPSDDDNIINGGIKVWQYEAVPIEHTVGPESIAFDPNGDGPYTGVSDGRIIKWQPTQNRWLNFAVTSSHRDDGDDEECGGPNYYDHPKREHICGRPLGLCFNQHTGELYVADAYKGLLVFGPNGGTATSVISQLELGEPLVFTNSLDIDQRTGTVYFTSSSSKYERRNYISLSLSKDNTGRLMKYDPQTKQVTILLNNLLFANGVALSKDCDYILIVETTNCRVLKYWLETNKAGTLEVFADLPGFPDNIKRSPRGGFWVGIHSKKDRLIQLILSYPWIGKALVKLPLDITKAYSYLAKLKGSTGFAVRLSDEGDVIEIFEDKVGKNRVRSISEVMEEKDGVLWVGSIDAPFVGKYNKVLVAQG